jgi:HD-GYP domain-containing protein (c-di-GMP phosphodiesterase class II)
MKSTSRIHNSSNQDRQPYLSLDLVLDHAVSQLHVDAIALFVKSSTGTFDFVEARGFRNSGFETTFLNPKPELFEQAFREERIVSIPDIRLGEKKFIRPQFLAAENFVSYHVAPLIVGENPQGIIEVYSRRQQAPIPTWLDLFDVISRYVGLALHNQALFNSSKKLDANKQINFGGTLDAWMAAMLLRGGEMERHARRVTDMTLRLAKLIGISDDQLIHLVRGAMLHDIGKLALPDSILQKSEKLTQSEWELMRMHPEFAYRLLSPLPYLKPALPIPYSHHERWDGGGYPLGFIGTQIPLHARIFTVVDVWDALRSDRPYRKAWRDVDVYQYISDQSGKHFDPQVTCAFLDLI